MMTTDELTEDKDRWRAEMAGVALGECASCNADITSLHTIQVNSMMRFIPRTHCITCHNLSILGLGSFAKTTVIGEGETRIEFSANPVGKGWMPVVEKLNEELTKLHPDYMIVQVKEKFGLLRYYTKDLPLYTAESEERAKDIRERAEAGEEIDWASQSNKVDREKDYTPAHNLIIEAQRKCAKLCEKCGDAGELSCYPAPDRYGWLLTLCSPCREADGKVTYSSRTEQPAPLAEEPLP